ncbi:MULTISPECIES: pyruvate dehydrogenase (acetyl-transferring) E1 component subunit alpha [Brevibacterium]|jgi:2-oxoisovalerate dehydrogenase E1 component alpha subunit|uniref:Pyruvate dehydrogenase (Acetyl-transferring) E1 component subunit alpha n=1 Tax=Brevibacterium salitolerans TaxID=1403566 RepID=A0ABN2X0D5_9MICO|nr:pyruvate dehydrogenase (acetyl-transferring) E1 component subunit alpha [Brevibacterium sp.]
MTSDLTAGSAAKRQVDPRMIQMLTPEGERVSSGEYDAFAAELSTEDLFGFYRDMVLVRRIDTEGNALQRQGQLGLWAPLKGQEAAQIGLGRALRPQDFVFPTYREHGVAWTRGIDPVQLLGMYRGQTHGGWDPQEKRFHTYTIVIGSQVLHATGYGMGIQMDGDVGTGDLERDSIAVACFGDGASSQGDVSEGLTFAGAFNAPVLFYCQNNQWAISEPTSVQTPAPLFTRGRGFGVPGIRVDGNDVLASYAVARASADSIRSGNGPMLIEAFTYRMGAHTTADDPTRYRSDAETEAWAAKDPIARLRLHLMKEGASSQEFASVDAEADQLAARIRTACVEMEAPDAEQLFAHVYREPHSLVEAEREEYLAYLDSFADADGRA